MNFKKSLRVGLSGLGASTLSMLGICCAGGLCAVACGAMCVAPAVTILGVSSAGISAWMSQLLPVFTAISAVAFTIAYYDIFKKKEPSCCESSPTPTNSIVPKKWAKSIFWIGLTITAAFYTYSMIEPTFSAASCDSSYSCSAPLEEGTPAEKRSCSQAEKL